MPIVICILQTETKLKISWLDCSEIILIARQRSMEMIETYSDEPVRMWLPDWPKRPSRWQRIKAGPWNAHENDMRNKWRWCRRTFGDHGKDWLYSPSQTSLPYEFFFRRKRDLALYLLRWQ